MSWRRPHHTFAVLGWSTFPSNTYIEFLLSCSPRVSGPIIALTNNSERLAIGIVICIITYDRSLKRTYLVRFSNTAQEPPRPPTYLCR